MLWLVVSNMAFIFHFIYGMSSETHWRSPSFFRGIETTNQFWWSNVIPWLPDYRDDRWVNDVARLAHLTISASNDLALFKNPGFLPPPPAGKRNIYWERQGWENMTHFSGKVAGKYLSGKAKAAAPRGPLPLAGHCPDPWVRSALPQGGAETAWDARRIPGTLQAGMDDAGMGCWVLVDLAVGILSSAVIRIKTKCLMH